MPRRKVPLKDTPDFTFMSNEEILVYPDMLERLMGSYRSVLSAQDYTVLERVWSDLVAEKLSCKDINYSAQKSFHVATAPVSQGESPVVESQIRPAPKIKKLSKRNI